MNVTNKLHAVVNNKPSTFEGESLEFIQKVLSDAWEAFNLSPEMTTLPNSELKFEYISLQEGLLQSALLDPTFYNDNRIDLSNLINRNRVALKQRNLVITSENSMPISENLRNYISENNIILTFINSIKNNTKIC